MLSALRSIIPIAAVASLLSASEAQTVCELRRPQSPIEEFQDLFYPDTCYRYFAQSPARPFRPRAADYDSVNAAWLADMALLAYVPTGEEQQKNGGKFDWDYLNGRGWTSSFVDDALHKAGLSVRYFGYDRNGTQAFVAHDDAFVAVVFRGTEVKDPVDLSADAIGLPRSEAMGGQVHGGFARALDAVWPDMEAHLKEVATDRSVWFAGHSLGAAIAVLAAARWVEAPGHKVAGLYTFGSPGVGDDQFTSALEDHVPAYRFVNDQDVVTTLNLRDCMNPVGRQTRRIGIDGKIAVSETEMPPAAGLPCVAGIGDTVSNVLIRLALWQKGPENRGLPRELADHSPRHYAEAIWGNLGD